MTNAEKARLRFLVRRFPSTSDEDLADECNCTIATVKRYRRVLAPLKPTDDGPARG